MDRDFSHFSPFLKAFSKGFVNALNRRINSVSIYHLYFQIWCFMLIACRHFFDFSFIFSCFLSHNPPFKLGLVFPIIRDFRHHFQLFMPRKNKGESQAGEIESGTQRGADHFPPGLTFPYMTCYKSLYNQGFQWGFTRFFELFKPSGGKWEAPPALAIPFFL